MNKKTKSYSILGVIFLLIGIFEWIISPLAFPEIPTLAPWLSFIIFLIGLYFFERAWNENRIQKGEITREQIKAKEMTWKQWALIFIGFIVIVFVIVLIMVIMLG
jgi:uncharacterized membrane protein